MYVCTERGQDGKWTLQEEIKSILSACYKSGNRCWGSSQNYEPNIL
jgi:hypothetical protein